MLIIALALAVIGLAALVLAVVTSNALVAWVCIAASLLGVLLLIVDGVRDRRRRAISAAEAEQPDIVDGDADGDEADAGTADAADAADGGAPDFYEEYPDELPLETPSATQDADVATADTSGDSAATASGPADD